MFFNSRKYSNKTWVWVTSCGGAVIVLDGALSCQSSLTVPAAGHPLRCQGPRLPPPNGPQ